MRTSVVCNTHISHGTGHRGGGSDQVLTIVILPVPLFLSRTLRALVSLCFFSRSMPTPMSPHCALPSLSFVILYTLLRISCTVSSSSSPSPSWSCADEVARRGGGWSPLVAAPFSSLFSPSSLDSVFSNGLKAGVGAKENGNDLTGPFSLAPSSGVFGGLPNPNPTGFPILPAFAAPNALEPPKSEGLPGDADPNEKPVFPEDDLSFSEVLSSVFAPKPKGLDNELELEPKREAVADLSASLSMSLPEPPKREGEVEDVGKMDVVEGGMEPPNSDGAEDGVDRADCPKSELPEDGAPNLNADVGADELELEVNDGEPKVNGLGTSLEDDSTDFEADGVKENALPRADGLLFVSIFGKKPSGAAPRGADADGVGGANPAKLVGGAGKENDGGGLDGSAAFDCAVVELEGVLEVDFDLPSKSDLTVTRNDLYRSRRSATSTNGSDSMAFETAERKDTFRPRRAL